MINNLQLNQSTPFNTNTKNMDLIVDFPQQRQSSKRAISSSSRVHRRSVAFAPEVELSFVENLSDLKELWTSKNDMKLYKIDAAYSVKHMKKYLAAALEGSLPEVIDTATFVGLEKYMTGSTLCGIEARKAAVRRAVLMEQNNQDMEGICDPDAIAAASEFESKKAVERAHCIGLLHSQP